MKLICPECGKEFTMSMVSLAMLKDSIKINPNLKVICSSCGRKIVEKYRK